MSIEWSGVPAFLDALQRVSEAVNVEVRAGVVEVASKIERAAKEAAPVVTGTLRRGIVQDPVEDLGGYTWQTRVYPTVVYSRRVELGFHGADSLGRNYDQTGRPYFGPAVAMVAAEAPSIFAKHMSRAIVGGA